jgi:hypothetical protein
MDCIKGEDVERFGIDRFLCGVDFLWRPKLVAAVASLGERQEDRPVSKRNDSTPRAAFHADATPADRLRRDKSVG